jgi:hypothetical protein
VHDRRLDGEALVFGNQGALFMQAMTWFDLETESIWSQPWGSAIAGPLEGRALTLLPAEVVPWSTWLAEHPGTTVLAGDLGDDRSYGLEGLRDGFVIGVAIGENAVGYHYRAAAEAGVVNDDIGDRPVVVLVDPGSRAIKVYLRVVPGPAPADGAGQRDGLTFSAGDDGRLTDVETGSTWDAARGVATDGPLTGAQLQRVPYVTSFDWAWEDFFPATRFWGG